jgi:hypothetical protein
MRGGSGDDRLPPWWVEVLVGVVGYVAYQLVQVLVTGSARSAIDRAQNLWAWERSVHLDPELTLNQLLSGHHPLVVVAGLYYSMLHFLVTPTVLVWLRIRRRHVYASLRNTLVGSSLIALLVFWWLPLAPPRLSIPGVVDTLKVDHILSAGTPSWPGSMANQYAAMPSLHVAWSVWVALALAVAIGPRPGRYLVWAYPLSTTVVVIATANHFLADTVAGAALVAAVWFYVRRGTRGGQTVAGPDRDIESGRAPTAGAVPELRSGADGWPDPTAERSASSDSAGGRTTAPCRSSLAGDGPSEG